MEIEQEIEKQMEMEEKICCQKLSLNEELHYILMFYS